MGRNHFGALHNPPEVDIGRLRREWPYPVLQVHLATLDQGNALRCLCPDRQQLPDCGH